MICNVLLVINKTQGSIKTGKCCVSFLAAYIWNMFDDFIWEALLTPKHFLCLLNKQVFIHIHKISKINKNGWEWMGMVGNGWEWMGMPE